MPNIAFRAASSTGSLSRRDDHPLQKRATLTCPEDIGGNLWTCSLPYCGGEDPSSPGVCKNADPSGGKCKCTTTGSIEPPSETTIVVTQSGATATGVYALQTISSLTGLKQAITTTIAQTTTATDGSTGIETAAAVIFAGGVSWFLASLVGDAIAGEVIEPPTTEPNHPNDPTCPNPAQKCSDCTGIAGICTTGAVPGCTCEEAACPTSKPKCSDENCAGNDQNKCTKNDVNCDCTPDEACPDDVDTLECSACGGGGREEICAGLAENNGRYKGCQCIGAVNSIPYEPDLINSASDVQAVLAALPPWDHLSFAQEPNLVPTCQRAGWTAPQRDPDGTPSVTASFTQWCSDMDGHTLTQNPGVDISFAGYRSHYYSYWLSAQNWYGAPAGNGCGKEVKISKQECINVFTEAMYTCDPNSGTTAGASFQGECISYNITLSGSPSTNPLSPPWNPLPPAANGLCDLEHPTDITLPFFQGIAPQFCSQISEGAALSKDLTQKDFKAVSSRSISLRTPPTSANMFEAKYGNDWTFHFDFSGAQGDCRKSCTDAYTSLSRSCGNTMSSSGHIDVGCGTYDYTITPPDPDETTCAISPSFYELSPKTTFTVDDANDAIGKFCADDKALVSNPMVEQPFVQNVFTDKPTYPFRYFKYGPTTIEIFAAFADTVGVAATDCKPDKEFTVNTLEAACKAALGKLLDRCDKDTQVSKEGGFTTSHGGENGCVVWQMFAYTETN
ncbi:hypothetical protein IFR05_009391 [Cadophora sp. M221]|nr:hypothetical protein IFR05_009391 [Cadophora sp. M221]